MREKIIGIDIGATRVKVILWKDKILERKVFNTPQKKESFSLLMKRLRKEFSSRAKIEKVSLSIPGVLDEKREKILIAPNLKFLSRVNFQEIFPGRKIKMENDAVCFTIAEAILGGAKEYSSVLGITLGSGVGGGFVLKEGKKIKVLEGAFGTALEPGRMVFLLSSRKKEILDNIGSNKFFRKKGGESEQFYRMALKGDKKARELFKEYGRNLGIGMANLVNIIDPEIIIFGGGISKAFRFFSPFVKKEMKKYILSPKSRKFVKIRKGKLGDFAGAIGAALLFQHDKD